MTEFFFQKVEKCRVAALEICAYHKIVLGEIKSKCRFKEVVAKRRLVIQELHKQGHGDGVIGRVLGIDPASVRYHWDDTYPVRRSKIYHERKGK